MEGSVIPDSFLVEVPKLPIRMFQKKTRIVTLDTHRVYDVVLGNTSKNQ
jgi:hypothetical protein